MALVHHANQYLITDGYEERQGMGEILGLGSLFWEREFHRRGLLPLLQMHLDYRVPLNLHMSGTLIETLAWHYPESFAQIKRLLRAGLLEIVGSAFSQNVMPFFSEDYNLRQMNEELWLFRRHLGVDPSRVKTFWVPERVWDTEKLARSIRNEELLNGGYSRVLLDDRLLYEAGERYMGSERERFDQGGLLEAETFRLWEIEDGEGLCALPISKRLRYAIPPGDCDAWQGLHALFGWLADLRDGEVLAVYGDDLERAAGVGGWEPVHPEGYEQLLRWLSGNENVRAVLINDWAEGRKPAGVRRIDQGTFYELAQLWNAGEDYRGWMEDPQCVEHRKHLSRAERALIEAEKRGADKGLIELGWKHLLHSSYETSWHNRAEENPGRDFSHLHEGRGMWLAPWAAALTSHARCCHVIARAAEWSASRDGEAHAEIADADGDGEEELILKNDFIYAVFSPTRGGRLIYLFDLTGRAGRLCIGNVSDDWNLQEEVNRYMDCPRNHPGALADVGYEHDRYEAIFVKARGETACVNLINVEESSGMRGAEKRLSLSSEAGCLCVSYALPPEHWRLSTEVCLSPDYYRLLRNGRRGVSEYNGRDWRGWQNGGGRVWVRVDSSQSTLWDKPYQAESGHGFNLRVTSFSKDFHLELGIGIPKASPCPHRTNGKSARSGGRRRRLRDLAQDSVSQISLARTTDRNVGGFSAVEEGQQPPHGSQALHVGPDGDESGDARASFRVAASDPAADDTRLRPAKEIVSSRTRAARSLVYKELVTSPQFIRQFFNRHLPSVRQRNMRVRSCRIRVLRPHHNKLTIEYNVRIGSGKNSDGFTQTFVGTWREDERNREMHDLLCALRDTGFDERDGLSVALPIAYWNSLHLRLREKVSGKLLRELLYYPDTDWDAPMRTVAAWIAKLHVTDLRVARRAHRRSETKYLRGWLRDMLACEESWIAHERERIEDLMEELIALHEERKPHSLCLTHGDFHPENIFVRGKTLTVIDFEQSELGDPAGDLGYLLAELDIQAMRYWEKRGGRSPLDVERMKEILLEEYARKRQRAGAPLWTPFYMARTYLKHLMHTVRMKGSESRQSVTLWLDKTEGRLDELRDALARKGERAARHAAAAAVKAP